VNDCPRAARLLGNVIAYMETIIIDDKHLSYTLYVATTKAGKRVMIAAYCSYYLGSDFTCKRVFSSRHPRLWRELRSMI
jgi:hypothetical protein